VRACARAPQTLLGVFSMIFSCAWAFLGYLQVARPLALKLHRTLEDEAGTEYLLFLQGLGATSFVVTGVYIMSLNRTWRRAAGFLAIFCAVLWSHVMRRYLQQLVMFSWVPVGPVIFFAVCMYFEWDSAQLDAQVRELEGLKYPYKKL
jgi:hypothetical protein